MSEAMCEILDCDEPGACTVNLKGDRTIQLCRRDVLVFLERPAPPPTVPYVGLDGRPGPPYGPGGPRDPRIGGPAVDDLGRRLSPGQQRREEMLREREARLTQSTPVIEPPAKTSGTSKADKA